MSFTTSATTATAPNIQTTMMALSRGAKSALHHALRQRHRLQIMTDREILDAVTLLLRNAVEAKNGTARGHDGEELFGFVIDHHDYMEMHCLLNLEPETP